MVTAKIVTATKKVKGINLSQPEYRALTNYLTVMHVQSFTADDVSGFLESYHTDKDFRKTWQPKGPHKVRVAMTKPKAEEKREPGVFIVHGSETLDGKHVVHFGTNFNNPRNSKKFKDWAEAVEWGNKKARSMDIPPERITLSSPVPSKVQVFIHNAKPIARMVGRVGKGTVGVGVSILKASDRFLTGQPFPSPKKRRKTKPKKSKLYTTMAGNAQLISRKPIRKPKVGRVPKTRKRKK